MGLGWLGKLFEKPEPAPPRYVDVLKANIKVVVNDDREFNLSMVGEYLGIHPFGGNDWVIDAEDRFHAWRERCGSTGSVGVGDGLYIPLCNIRDISVKYSEHKVEVKQ